VFLPQRIGIPPTVRPGTCSSTVTPQHGAQYEPANHASSGQSGHPPCQNDLPASFAFGEGSTGVAAHRDPALRRTPVLAAPDYTDEVDEDAAVAAQLEREERERWERQQQAIA
jgi:hypothetical protein